MSTTSTKSKIASSVLVITVPMLLLALIGLLSGSLALGTPEVVILTVIWVVGLIWIWRPRKAS